MNSQPPFDWPALVQAFTPEHAAKLANWRDYSPGFVAWLMEKGIVGIFKDGNIAFPVHGEDGKIIACHYRLKGDKTWRYHPSGTRTCPLIIGLPANASVVWVFESQWDAFAVMDRLGLHQGSDQSDTAVVITRGAENGKLIAGRCLPDAIVYAFAQNDPPRADGKLPPADKWLVAIAASCGCKCLHIVTPKPHKDANDWTRAGATAEQIQCAIAEAQLVLVTVESRHQPAPDLHARAQVTVETPGDVSDELPPAPFPLDALPSAMAGIIAGVSRCERVPLALPAVCALGVISAAIGAGLEVVSGPNRTTPGNLYLVGFADSGSGKSECFRIVAAPLVDHQTRVLEVWRTKISPQLQSEIAVLSREITTLERKAAKAADPSERERLRGEMEYRIARKDELARKAAMPCTITQDVTIERLAVLLQENREVMFSASADARKVIDNVMGRYSATKTTDESLYLSAFSLEFVRVDRQSREPVVLNKPCLALCWFVQPDLLVTMLDAQSLSASGFLPRLLICHTNATPRKIEGDAPGISDAVRAQWTKLADDLLATFHAADKPHRIEPTPEAKRLLDDFHNIIVDRRQSDLADVGAFAARYAEQAWRVSVVLHAALHGAAASNHPLERETAANAIRVVEWFIVQQLDILARGRRQAQHKVDDEVLELLERRQERTGKDFITARDVHHARIVPTAEAARALLARMEADGQLFGEDVRPERGGRATRIYRSPEDTNPVRP